MNKNICHSTDCDTELTGMQEKWCSKRCQAREIMRAKAMAKKIENGAPWECQKCHERKVWKGYQKICNDCKPKSDNKFSRRPRPNELEALAPKPKLRPVRRATSMAEAMLLTEGKRNETSI